MFIEYHDSNWNVILTTLKVYMKVFLEEIQVTFIKYRNGSEQVYQTLLSTIIMCKYFDSRS